MPHRVTLDGFAARSLSDKHPTLISPGHPKVLCFAVSKSGHAGTVALPKLRSLRPALVDPFILTAAGYVSSESFHFVIPRSRPNLCSGVPAKRWSWARTACCVSSPVGRPGARCRIGRCRIRRCRTRRVRFNSPANWAVVTSSRLLPVTPGCAAGGH